MFGMKPEPGVQLTLITRDVDTPYSGMLPGYVAGSYTWRECHIDLAKLASFANAQLVHAEACGIDTYRKQILLKGRPPISYDVVSIDIGSAPKPVTFKEENGIAPPSSPMPPPPAAEEKKVEAPETPTLAVAESFSAVVGAIPTFSDVASTAARWGEGGGGGGQVGCQPLIRCRLSRRCQWQWHYYRHCEGGGTSSCCGGADDRHYTRQTN